MPSAEVVVVGAGLAGLTAALRVSQAQGSVIVLEARPCPGGRVRGHLLPDGTLVEEGGAFVGPTQDRVLALAEELGVDTFDPHTGGSAVYALGDRAGDDGLSEFADLVKALECLASGVDPAEPWTAHAAAEHDGETLEGWLRTTGAGPASRRLMEAMTRTMLGAEPREISMLFILAVIARSGNETTPGSLQRSIATRDGAQMWRFRGGAQVLADRLAELLGDKIVFGAPVERIDWEEGSVHVQARRMSVHAPVAIITVPPALAHRIAFSPPLPAAHDQLCQRLPQGVAIKASAVYDRAFWRDAGLSGGAITTGDPFSVTYDASPADRSAGILAAFIGGEAARAHSRRSSGERRSSVVNELAALFGPLGAEPRAYLETDWSADPWSRGYSMAVAAPGALLHYGPHLREPVGPIHWAGTDTAPYWSGYMEGAVRSGERAGQEASARLGSLASR